MAEIIYQRRWMLPIVAVLVAFFVLIIQRSAAGEPKFNKASTDEISLFLAGDTIITQPWSHIKEPAFLRLVDEIRGADRSEEHTSELQSH